MLSMARSGGFRGIPMLWDRIHWQRLREISMRRKLLSRMKNLSRTRTLIDEHKIYTRAAQ